jgi:hypothetical protein
MMGGNLSSDGIEKARYPRSWRIVSSSVPGKDRGLPRLAGYLRWAVRRGWSDLEFSKASGCLDDDIFHASKWLESFGCLCSADGHMDFLTGNWAIGDCL